MRLRSESKGISVSLASLISSLSRHKPALAAITSSAPSVGSPRIDHSLAGWPLVTPRKSPLTLTRPRSRTELLQRAAAFIIRLKCRSCLSTPPVNSPLGSYPSPFTPMVRSLTIILRTVISFCVSVPVLSEQITVEQPRVSTAGSLRITAWRLIIRCTPRASATVTMAGRPSGMAATARLTPARNIW
ncbi:MAG: hypothetical protein BWY65_01808 [Firmicutes bacterium ADurb.Bin373]|nr:MAG: hypothetical protein BWY65_01808 [Firmicutes bacterium ADurb.Bin373]